MKFIKLPTSLVKEMTATELIVFGTLWTFWQSPQGRSQHGTYQYAMHSLDYYHELLGMNRKAVVKARRSLIEKGYLEDMSNEVTRKQTSALHLVPTEKTLALDTSNYMPMQVTWSKDLGLSWNTCVVLAWFFREYSLRKNQQGILEEAKPYQVKQWAEVIGVNYFTFNKSLKVLELFGFVKVTRGGHHSRKGIIIAMDDSFFSWNTKSVADNNAWLNSMTESESEQIETLVEDEVKPYTEKEIEALPLAKKLAVKFYRRIKKMKSEWSYSVEVFIEDLVSEKYPAEPEPWEVVSFDSLRFS